ncbi:MAG: hypothetical protein BWK75_02845, partial [Candidatus Altiarchaeales archaeon A3]
MSKQLISLLMMSHYNGPLINRLAKATTPYVRDVTILAFDLWPKFKLARKLISPKKLDFVTTLEPFGIRIPIVLLQNIPKSMTVMDIYTKWMANQAVKELNKLNIHPDLIHAQFIYPGGLIGVHLKKIYDVPLVVTAHGHDIYSLPFLKKDFMEMTLKVIKNSDHIITVSNSNYEVFKKLNLDDKVTVIPNSYSDELFKPMEKSKARQTLSLLQDKKIILAVGNLQEIKGHEYLINAIDMAIKKDKTILCSIIGTGQSRPKLQKLINDLNLNNYVKLVGAKLHDEIPLWMNACDLFVLPSLRESFGIVQIEA